MAALALHSQGSFGRGSFHDRLIFGLKRPRHGRGDAGMCWLNREFRQLGNHNPRCRGLRRRLGKRGCPNWKLRAVSD